MADKKKQYKKFIRDLENKWYTVESWRWSKRRIMTNTAKAILDTMIKKEYDYQNQLNNLPKYVYDDEKNIKIKELQQKLQNISDDIDKFRRENVIDTVHEPHDSTKWDYSKKLEKVLKNLPSVQ